MARADDLIAGRYRLVEQIAVGGMSAVWSARDERLRRRVAVKLLHPQGAPGEDPHVAGERAMREARITARLHHPNAVPVYDVVDHDGAPCLVMQYVPSRSLQALITERGALDVPTVARIGAEVAAALTAAHEVGIVHRDVKPGNVLIATAGTALLTDFGISHALGDVSLTSTGMVTGTPAFLAPEVARGDPSSVASDVFSLGATLYAALEGVPPFGTGDNPMAVLHRVASAQVLPPRRSGVLTPVLSAMLQLDPSRRPPMAWAAAELTAAARAGADPAARAATQRISPGPPSAVPPSTTVSLPPATPARRVRPTPAVAAGPPGPVAPRRLTPEPSAPPPAERSGRRPTGLLGGAGRWLAVAAAVLLLAGIAVLLISQLGGSGNPSAGGTGTNTLSPASRSTPRTSAAASKASSTHAQSSSRSTSSAAASTTHSSSSAAATSASTSGSTSAGSSGGGPLVQAIDDYYALLPGNTDAAWARLTPSYQRYPGGGRQNYDQYWNSMASVSATQVTSTGKSTVTATITYRKKNGDTSVERTSFGLVQDGGTYKINTSSVLSSQ